jgi:CRISPR-associated protein Cas5h
VVDEAPARPLSAVRFRWRARFGFFLRAEAPVVGLGYPVPPRTAVLGLIANVLGLPKDALADRLEGARVALSGTCPRTHWHGCNLRKIKQMRFLPPTFSAKKPVELVMAEESNTQSRQEWLCDPDFEVIAVLPDALHDEFAARVREGRTYFTPCMGLSEMLASIEHVSDETLTPLPDGMHRVRSVVRPDGPTRLAVDAVLGERLRVLSLSLPRTVTEDRRFTHASYFVAPDGGSLPVHTASAWQSEMGAVMFL